MSNSLISHRVQHNQSMMINRSLHLWSLYRGHQTLFIYLFFHKTLLIGHTAAGNISNVNQQVRSDCLWCTGFPGWFLPSVILLRFCWRRSIGPLSLTVSCFPRGFSRGFAYPITLKDKRESKFSHLSIFFFFWSIFFIPMFFFVNIFGIFSNEISFLIHFLCRPTQAVN